MGFFSKLKNPFKKIFNKDVMQNLGLDALTGGLWGPIEGFTGKGGNLFSDIHRGFANMMTGGAMAQKESTDEARKARDLAQQQYAEAEAKAKAVSDRLANEEEERKRRLAMFGTKKPETLLGGYLGLGGAPNVSKPTLG